MNFYPAASSAIGRLTQKTSPAPWRSGGDDAQISSKRFATLFEKRDSTLTVQKRPDRRQMRGVASEPRRRDAIRYLVFQKFSNRPETPVECRNARRLNAPFGELPLHMRAAIFGAVDAAVAVSMGQADDTPPNLTSRRWTLVPLLCADSIASSRSSSPLSTTASAMCPPSARVIRSWW